MDTGVNESSTFDYNWDELSFGNSRVDHFGNFFANPHPAHEKLEKNALNRGNIRVPGRQNNPADNGVLVTANDANVIVQNVIDDNATALQSAQSNIHSNNNNNKEFKSPPPLPPAAAKQMNQMKDFNVVRFIELYDAKKKEKLRRVEQMEREKRQFHSKPAPNFNAIHAAVERKKQPQPVRYTCPATPTVVRRHREAQERVQKKKEEYEASLQPKPFISNANPEVLRSKPFVPQFEKCHITPAPFNLHTESRLRERRIFDENFKTEADRRQQEEEEQRQRAEEKLRREMRKATQFKAQPNPFNKK